MGYAEDLFNRMSEIGLSEVQSLWENRASEELFLEFKTSSDCGSGTKLSAIDRNNLGKAISGFGNGEGGVLVWGIDCRDSPEQGDIARSPWPIQNPSRFKSWLESAVAGVTSPPHPYVRHHAIEREDGKGFVVTLISASDHAPHQDLNEKRYYLRAGSGFVPVLHNVLAGMFGRRPAPSIKVNWLPSKGSIEYHGFTFNFITQLLNDGPVIATNIAVTIQTIDCFPSKIQPLGHWESSIRDKSFFSVISPIGFRLPPGALVRPVEISLFVPWEPTRSLRINWAIGCDDMRATRHTFYSPKEKLAEIMGPARMAFFDSRANEINKYQLAREILGYDKDDTPDWLDMSHSIEPDE